jgi:hypothetical protein
MRAIATVLSVEPESSTMISSTQSTSRRQASSVSALL